jgi:uncharacterized protein (DUF1501 family)
MTHPHRQMNCCSGFTRAEALRAAADGAGRGPREWDSSMPVPAGTGMDRRRFLLAAAGGLVSVYGAGRVGLGGRAFSEGIARAAQTGSSDGPILVSIFLAGGLDALSVLAPLEDSAYRKLRPTLGISESGAIPFTEDPTLSWSANAAGFAQLHDAGKMIVMPGSGYAGEDMSHFTSRHYWEVGATDESITTGWLGRYLDAAGSPDNPLQGLSMDSMMNPTLATAHKPVAAIDLPESFSLWIEGMWDPIFTETLDAASRLGDLQRHHHDRAIAQVAEAASEVGYVRRAMKPFRAKDGGPAYTSPVTYPTMSSDDFPKRLAGLAAMIHAGLPLRCVALTPNTQFDTHSSQASTFSDDVPAIAASIAAFQADLEARGVDRRVLIHVWSEFGRRAAENGSGTDHGAAGLSMLIGSRVTGTMLGEFPALGRLDPNGNQRVNVDFRGVYSSLLEQWFDHDPASVIPDAHRFPRYELVT